MTHDYNRPGTTTLFAALNVLDGTVIGRNMQRHRHQEFIRFLNPAKAQVPVRMAIHGRQLRDPQTSQDTNMVGPAFTPTSASWLNASKAFFAKLTRRRLKRGAFRSVADLQAGFPRAVGLRLEGIPLFRFSKRQ